MVSISKQQSNFLKGLAIIAIVCHNYFHLIYPSPGENEFGFEPHRVFDFFHLFKQEPLGFINILFSYLGHFGVQVFIFLSGYGLSKSFKNHQGDWRSFLAKRILSLESLLIIGVLAFFVFHIVHKQSLPNGEWWLSVGYKLLFINNFISNETLSLVGPWWFFAIIAQLYLVFPLLYWFIKRTGNIGLWALVVLGAGFILSFYNEFAQHNLNIMAHVPAHLPEFALGIWLALRPSIELKKIWFYMAGAVFILGNFIWWAFPLTFISAAVLWVYPVLWWTNKKPNLLSNQNFVMICGAISMYLFVVNGFMRAPFYTVIEPFKSPVISLLFFAPFAMVVFGSAYIIDLIETRLSNLTFELPKRISQIVSTIKQIGRLNFGNHLLIIIGATAFSLIATKLILILNLQKTQPIDVLDYNALLFGLLRDMAVVLKFTAYIILPFIVIHYFSRKIAFRIAKIIYALFIIANALLSAFFIKALTPLDDVVLSYTLHDALLVITSSDAFDLSFVMMIALPQMVFWSILYFFNPHNIKNSDAKLLILTIIGFSISTSYINPSPSRFENDNLYGKAVSFPAHLIKSCLKANNKSASTVTQINKKLVYDYRSSTYDFKYIDTEYPFCHSTVYPNVLSPFIKSETTQKPNYVFIIMESLGGAYAGSKAKNISVTPFLDSLSRVSLYWPNCLSASERTFGVLPAMFSSSFSFADMRQNMPEHQSMVRSFKENGYQVSFYYGGNPDFDGMYHYMIQNGAVMPIANTDQNIDVKSENPTNNWGWSDDVLFKKRETECPVNLNKPFVDVYLTLSSHIPYTYPNKIENEAEFVEYLTKYNEHPYYQTALSQKEHLSSVYYADKALHQLMAFYQNNNSLNNTIFVITGDHQIGLVPQINDLDRFNVPLIIFSPNTIKPKTFEAVVTHFDLAPSILTFMTQYEGFTIPELKHWLGDGLDTTPQFTCRKKVAFMRNNRKIVDYLSDSIYLSNGRLYQLQSGLKLKPITDSKLQNRLQKQSETTELVFYQCAKHNRLYKSGRGEMVFSFSNNLEDLKAAKNKSITLDNPIEGEKSYSLDPKDVYGNLMPEYVFEEDYRKIEVTVTFKIRFPETPIDKLPFVGIQLGDKKKTPWNLMHELKFDEMESLQNDIFQASMTYMYRVTKELKGQTLKVFIFNPNKLNMTYDDIIVELKGYNTL